MATKIQDSGKFHLRIAFTNYYIYTNQFHFKTEKPLQKPETSIKDGLKKWNLNFHLEYSVWKNRTILILDVLLLLKNVPLEWIKKSGTICFPTRFSGNFEQLEFYVLLWFPTIFSGVSLLPVFTVGGGKATGQTEFLTSSNLELASLFLLKWSKLEEGNWQ